MWSIEIVGWLLFLMICSWIDLRSRSLPTAVFITAVIGSGISIIAGGVEPILAAGGLIIGLLCLFFSRVTREGLGYGDSMLILFLGVGIGLWQIIGVLMIAFFSAAGYSACLLIFRRKNRHYAYPFVPFLLVGYLGVIWF